MCLTRSAEGVIWYQFGNAERKRIEKMNKPSNSISVYATELFKGRPIKLNIATFLGNREEFDLIANSEFFLSKREASKLMQLLKLELLNEVEICNFCEMVEGLTGTYCESCYQEFGTC